LAEPAHNRECAPRHGRAVESRFPDSGESRIPLLVARITAQGI
jgi:hypothetical protein